MEIMLFVQFQEKKIQLEKLSYWNVELQEAYFSYVEASKKKIKIYILQFPFIMCPDPLFWIQ